MMAMTANSGDDPIVMDYPSRGGRQAHSSDQVEMNPSRADAPSTFPLDASNSKDSDVWSNRQSGTDVDENRFAFDRRLSGDGSSGPSIYNNDVGRRHSAPLPSGLSALIMAATSQLSHCDV